MYHLSVLLKECLEGLAINPDGVYVDVTYGGGGHAKAILEQLGKGGKLYAFDQDQDALKNAVGDSRLHLIHANFASMRQHLRLNGITQVDGILADLGVSSYQFDTADRGFSFRFEGPLDMRMNQAATRTAADVLNQMGEEELVAMFSLYGEVPNSKRLAKAIVERRATTAFSSIQSLLQITESLAMGEKHKYHAQVFQAIRIEVNQELEVLKQLLLESAALLKPDGRLVVLTFHSLEDRLVKQFVKNGVFAEEPIKDEFGRFEAPLKAVNKKPIIASKEEQKINSRSRSAKLRIAEKQ